MIYSSVISSFFINIFLLNKQYGGRVTETGTKSDWREDRVESEHVERVSWEPYGLYMDFNT